MIRYPPSVICIIAAEFCERFSFCGLRTILSLYFRNILHYSENRSTLLYHVFIMSCYIVPLVSAVLADSYLGNYRTILYFSIIYFLGCILMSLSAIPAILSYPTIMSMSGLALIALGTGGMKPCIAAFGAEQFTLPGQKDMLSSFFSIFYSTINLGGFVGMIVVPALKKSLACYGEDTCYAVGFGLPAFLMAIALVFFIFGRQYYKVKVPKRNVILQFIKCGSYALAQKFKKNRTGRHWLDRSRGKYNQKLIEEMKLVFSILLLYTPLPIFWSLFDQQGSRWTFQAAHMNGNFLGMVIIPDQIQVINPIMVFILIPGFNRLFYPLLQKWHIIENSLQRMAIGGIAAGLAFFAAGILELVLETTYPQVPDKQHAFLNIINTLPCEVKIKNFLSGEHNIQSGDIYSIQNINCKHVPIMRLKIICSKSCGYLHFSRTTYFLETKCVFRQVDTVLVGVHSCSRIHAFVVDRVDLKKSLLGAARLRIVYLKDLGSFRNVTVSLKNAIEEEHVYFVPDFKSDVSVSTYMEIKQGVYQCTVGNENDQYWFEKDLHLAFGGVYSLVIREDHVGIAFMELYTMAVPSTVSMLWQVPQYVLISVAEIMFGIAGLEFSFTQAPRRLKTIVIAGWYLSVAMGNFLVIVITQLQIFKCQAHEFFLFSMLMVIDMVIFVEISSNFEIVKHVDATTSASVVVTEASYFVEKISKK